MYIKKIKLKNYRNYKEVEVDFDKGINIFYGNNAEGKTNLLESIYLSSTSKSHKNSKENEIINFYEKEAHIKIILEKEKEYSIDIQLNKDEKKGIAINGKKLDKISDFLGIFNVVLFAPEDLNIIREGPQVRRKFLDVELCQIDKVYVKLLSSYNKILNQRNALLKDLNFVDNNNKKELVNILDAYDEQLVNYGVEIIIKRKENVDELKKYIKDIHYKISDEKENLYIEYECQLEKDINDKETLKKIYTYKLIESRDIDIRNQYTLYGPQRDDISFKIENIDIRKFGSQGQKKTAAISLKLSELLLLKDKIKDEPVLLLDDVFSELDETRQKLLVNNLKDIQTIITCTGIKRNIFELLKPNKIFKVAENKILEVSGDKNEKN